ncbi:Calcineurin-like phosphoesterase domain-containing protein [Plasmodiophora brassicae]
MLLAERRRQRRRLPGVLIRACVRPLAIIVPVVLVVGMMLALPSPIATHGRVIAADLLYESTKGRPCARLDRIAPTLTVDADPRAWSPQARSSCAPIDAPIADVVDLSQTLALPNRVAANAPARLRVDFDNDPGVVRVDVECGPTSPFANAQTMLRPGGTVDLAFHIPPGTSSVLVTIAATAPIDTVVSSIRRARLDVFAAVPPLDVRQRSSPMLFDHDDGAVGVQWESNCNLVGAFVVLVGTGDRIPTRTIQVGPGTFLHRAKVQRGGGGDLRYKVVNGDAVQSATFAVVRRRGDGHARLAITSDSQSSAARFRDQLAQIAVSRADLVVHVGDFVQDPAPKEYRTYWTAPFEASGLGPTTPIRLVRGNHDGEAPLSYAYSYGPGNNAWGAFSVASARMIVLDSNVRPGDDLFEQQTAWLAAEVTSGPTRSATFVVAFVHVPPFIEFWDPAVFEENEAWSFVREVWLPMLTASGVDLIVSGHSHIYQRGTYRGVHVAIVGGGGGDLDRVRANRWRSVYSVTRMVFHYIVVDVSPDRLDWTCYSTAGAVVDTLTITPRPPR